MEGFRYSAGKKASRYEKMTSYLQAKDARKKQRLDAIKSTGTPVPREKVSSLVEQFIASGGTVRAIPARGRSGLK